MIVNRLWREYILDDVYPRRGIKFSKLQQSAIDKALLAPSRFFYGGGGERSGKSFLAAVIALLWLDAPIFTGEKRPPTEYWIAGNDYYRSRAEFQYMWSVLSSEGLLARYHIPDDKDAQWTMTTSWGATIKTLSTSVPADISSFSINGFIMAEPGRQKEEAHLRLHGRVSETSGWGISIGTNEKSRRWFTDVLASLSLLGDPSSPVVFMPTWANEVAYPGGLANPEILRLRRKYGSNIELFDERYAGGTASKTGLILPEFMESFHCKPVEHNPAFPVEVAIDPATHTYAVWFVQPTEPITVLDSIYLKRTGFSEVYAAFLEHPLHQHVTTGVIDIAGNAHQANLSQVELWRQEGVRLRYQYNKVDSSIEAVRDILRPTDDGKPKILFSYLLPVLFSESRQAQSALGEFVVWSYKETERGHGFETKPDEYNCDAIKALAYWLLASGYTYNAIPVTPPVIVERGFPNGNGFEPTARATGFGIPADPRRDALLAAYGEQAVLDGGSLRVRSVQSPSPNFVGFPWGNNRFGR